ncbi:uncharacterized protein LOC129568496 isoform X2 [Sitodiplosis mosellana]|uniref:uncharacterized protein LOC129568496 isoform X2 n=1 Tax=Sitodiplosis mosellana TaxID=263140 RepID=UPI0024447047|nr:uncharacterized protein LOC129568496 isoform X2 [Sitodiplosis mosellana]
MAGTKRKKRDSRQRKQKRRTFLFEVIERDPSDNTPKTEMMSINDNCIEEVLEWLSLSDLVSLSTTCKRMKDVVSRYFGRKYPTKRITIKMDSDLRGRIEYWPRELYVQRFREYFQNIAIRGRQPIIFRHVGSFCNKTPKKLRILEAKALTEMHGKCIEDLLKNVEIVEFEDCSFATDFYDSFLKYCLNLKQLVLKSFAECTHNGTKNRWLLHKYPHLRRLSWSFDEKPPEELTYFFHRNPKVQSFAAAKFPLEITKLITNAGIKFDELCLDIGFGVDLNMKQIFQSIEQLHQQGQFKKLQMIPTTSMFVAAKFPPMPYLEAIMANQVFEDVIAAMKSLKKISLGKLSKERAKLVNARPLAIYLKEELFVNIKWAEENLKQGLVEIKRAESHFVNNTLVRM